PRPPAPAAKKPAAPKFVGDQRDRAVEAGLANVGAVLAGEVVGKGKNAVGRGRLGDRDMYFLWSLERVGVIYGLDKIGKIDWYELGSDLLIPAQNRDGSWSGGSHGTEVDTAFALLFLARSNLVRDLSAKVQRDPLNAELRGGPSPIPEAPGAAAVAGAPAPEPKTGPIPAPLPKVEPAPAATVPPAPKPAADDEGTKLAAALVKVPAGAWTRALEQVRDGKGGDFTKALVVAIGQLDGDRKKDV